MAPASAHNRKLLNIVSFGHCNGPLSPPPLFSYDIRDIPNPPREFRLQQRASNDATALRQWLLNNEVFRTRIEDARRQVWDWMDRVNNFEPNNEYCITVGVNCQLGRHRSVTFAEELARRLEENLGDNSLWEIKVRHRDLERKSRRFSREFSHSV